MLLLEAACIGSFLSLDLLLFFLFFEPTLVPGVLPHRRLGPRAPRATRPTKFFLYTFVASAFMLVGILALVFIHAEPDRA